MAGSRKDRAMKNPNGKVTAKDCESRWTQLDAMFDNYKANCNIAMRERVMIAAYNLFTVEYLRHRLKGRSEMFLSDVQIHLFKRIEPAFDDPSVVEKSFTGYVFGKLRSVVDGVQKKHLREFPIADGGGNEDDTSDGIKVGGIAKTPSPGEVFEEHEREYDICNLLTIVMKKVKVMTNVDQNAKRAFALHYMLGLDYVSIARTVYHYRDGCCDRKVYTNKVAHAIHAVSMKLRIGYGETAKTVLRPVRHCFERL